MKCAHLHPSIEAYHVDPATGQQTPATVYLCEWPDQNPDRFMNAPRWLLKLVGSGLAVMPEHDCVGCPGYRAGQGWEQ